MSFRARARRAFAGVVKMQLKIALLGAARERGDLAIAEEPGAVPLARRHPPKTH